MRHSYQLHGVQQARKLPNEVSLEVVTSNKDLDFGLYPSEHALTKRISTR